jgi:single-stranded-DNA-specific exonuclease
MTITSILANRGITSDNELQFFLNDDPSLIRSPFDLPNIHEAVSRIIVAKERHEKVLVFGDRDADGITATALLTHCLRKQDIDTQWRVPVGDEPYGLSMEAVEEFATIGGKLIITVDCGISNHLEIEWAKEWGVDVIITDHHNPHEILPDAVAIVNPKLLGSAYPFPDICGCAIAYKLFIALIDTLKNHLPSEDNLVYLQLVAIGTIADIVPLRDENRTMVRRGMEAIGEKPCPGLSSLLGKLGLLRGRITSEDLGWTLCPAINATGRMGSPDKAVALFLEQDSLKREQLAGEIKTMHGKRKRISNKLLPLTENMARRSLCEYEGKLAVAAGEQIIRGVTGIMANRLLDSFKVPTIVVSLGETTATGSVRSPDGYDLRRLIEPISELFIDYGGHKAAAGFSLPIADWQIFLKRLKSAALSIPLMDEPVQVIIKVDERLHHTQITPRLLTLIDMLEPYGNGNEEIIFQCHDLKLLDIEFWGKPEPRHITATLDTGLYKWPAVYWNSADKAGRDFSNGDKVDAVFSICRNRFRGIQMPRIIIKELIKSA